MTRGCYRVPICERRRRAHYVCSSKERRCHVRIFVLIHGGTALYAVRKWAARLQTAAAASSVSPRDVAASLPPRRRRALLVRAEFVSPTYSRGSGRRWLLLAAASRCQRLLR